MCKLANGIVDGTILRTNLNHASEIVEGTTLSINPDHSKTYAYQTYS